MQIASLVFNSIPNDQIASIYRTRASAQTAGTPVGLAIQAAGGTQANAPPLGPNSRPVGCAIPTAKDPVDTVLMNCA
jgi:hypothetical protein